MPQLPDWVHPVADYMFKVGVKHTLEIAAVSVAASAVIGVLLGTLLTIRWLPLRAAIRGYIEVWRGLPIIVTIFLMFFGLPTLADELHVEALRLTALNAAWVGLTLWGSAQVAEATRGAIQSIPREQTEAAAALGFGWLGTQVNVVLPQAFRRLLPPLVGLLVNVIQNTTIAALIGVPEVLQSGQREVERREGEVFNFTGLERSLGDGPDDDVAPALYGDRLRELALEHLGGDGERDDVFVANRMTAAIVAAMQVLVLPGARVAGVSPSYSHPAVVRAVRLAGGELDDGGPVAGADAVVLTRLAVTYEALPPHASGRGLAEAEGPLFLDD